MSRRGQRPILLLALLAPFLLAGCTTTVDDALAGVEDTPGDAAADPSAASAMSNDTAPTDASVANASGDAATAANDSLDGAMNASAEGPANASTDGSANATDRGAIPVENASLGGTVSGDRSAVTVHDAVFVEHLPELDTKYSSPATVDEQFVVVDLSIANTGDSDVRLARRHLDLQLTDDEGYVYDSYWIDGTLADVLLLPDTRRRGPVVFKAPRSANEVTLHVTVNLTAPYRGRWSVERTQLRYSREHASRPAPAGTITGVSMRRKNHTHVVGEVALNNTADRHWTPAVDVYLKKLDWEYTARNVSERVTLDPNEEDTLSFWIDRTLPENGRYYSKIYLRGPGGDELDVALRNPRFG